MSGLLGYTDGTATNGINMFFGSTPAYDPSDLRHEIWVSNANTSGGCGTSNFALGSWMKEVFAYQTNDLKGAVNGTLCAGNTSNSFPTLTSLYIGNARTDSSTSALDGWINRVWYMPTRQPDASLPDYTR